MECDGIFAPDTLYHKQIMYGINATEFLSGVLSWTLNYMLYRCESVTPCTKMQIVMVTDKEEEDKHIILRAGGGG